MVRELSIRNFDKGIMTTLEAQSLPEQAASRSLNWLTLGDKIELSGGYSVVGTELAGTGKVTGLKVAEKVDGSLLPIRTRGRKIEYYTTDWVESGTDLLPLAASGEDVAITQYTSLAGYQVWISSPNSSLYKMMIANPGSIKDVYDAAKNFKSYIVATNNRLIAWYRVNNKNYLYGSYKDLQNTTVYTNIVAEAVGVSGGTVYAGTLATISGSITCFNVVFTDGVTTLQDNKNGLITGTGGSGTINYATGVYSVTFTSPTVAAVTTNYSHENSTQKGVADFTFSSPARTAAQGFFLPQGTGGDLQNVLAYRSEYYCMHQRNCWLLSILSDDLTVTNEEFRQNMGMENWRAAVPTGDGIYYIDASDPSKPRFKLLTTATSNDQVEPQEISFNIDLSGYDFSNGVGHKWNDYILFQGKTKGSANNNRLFAFNTIWKSFDQLGYYANVFANKDSELWAGDSASNNVLKLFTGTTANGASIVNYWEGKLSKLDLDELKKFRNLTLRGQIGRSQTIKVSLAYDNGSFQEVGRVEGTGSYVSGDSGGIIGSSEVGSSEIGGGGSGISAFNYVRELSIRSGKFDEVKIRIEALDVGYASVSEIKYHDIKAHGQKNLLRYRNN